MGMNSSESDGVQEKSDDPAHRKSNPPGANADIRSIPDSVG